MATGAPSAQPRGPSSQGWSQLTTPMPGEQEGMKCVKRKGEHDSPFCSSKAAPGSAGGRREPSQLSSTSVGSMQSAGFLPNPPEHRACPAPDLRGPGCILIEPMLESAGFLGSSLIKHGHENFMRRAGDGGQGASGAPGGAVPPAVPARFEQDGAGGRGGGGG